MEIYAWLIGLMVWASPPERIAVLPAYPGWSETPAARAERYRGIAEAATRVAFDPREAPLESGPTARGRTAAILLAVAFHESGFAPDVDRGPCYRDSPGARWRCDGGRSACLMQVMVGEGTTLEGWTRDELFADREKCFRAGLHKLQRSAKRCTANGPTGRFAGFTGGNCDDPRAVRASAVLVGQARRWLTRPPTSPADALWSPPPPPRSSDPSGAPTGSLSRAAW